MTVTDPNGPGTPTADAARPSRLARLIAFTILGVGLVAGVLSWVVPAATAEQPAAAVWLTAVVPLAGCALIGVVLARAVRGDAPLGGGAMRVLIYAVGVAAIVQVVRLSPFAPATFTLVLHVAISTGAGLVLLDRPLRRVVPAGPRFVLDLVFGVGLFLIVGGELGLRVIAWQRPQPIFSRRDESPTARLENHRPRPGALRFGFPFDARGYADEPIPPEQAADRVVVVGDGAILAVVPHALSPTSVAEQRRPGTPFADRAVDGVGPLEYALVVAEELALDPPPAAVIVALDLQDDLQDVDRRDDVWTPFASWLDRENVLLTAVFDHFQRRSAEAARRGTPLIGAAFEEFTVLQPVPADRVRDTYGWLDTPNEAAPTWSDHRLGTLAEDRVVAALGEGSDDRFVKLQRALEAIVTDCREHDVPCGVLLIPARDQLDDLLWSRVAPDGADRAARLAPQRRLAVFLTGAGVPHFDATPLLRTVAAGPGGVDALFHPGDTRVTARGAAVLGDALAAVAERLVPKPR